MKILLGLLGAFALATSSAVVGTTWVVVDVREGGPQGHHIWAPVPLELAQFALHFVDDETQRVEIPELANYAPAGRKILAALREAEDGVFIKVDDDSDHVEIGKYDDVLAVSVDGGDGEQVRVRVPIRTAMRILDGYDGEALTASQVVRALRYSPATELVHVIDGEDEVRVRIW